MKDTADFVFGLLERVPELRATYDEHLGDNDELLPHVFFGDVTRFAVAASADPIGCEAIKRLLVFVSNGLTDGSENVQELVVVSFVENLIGEHEALARLKPLMPEPLRQEVIKICG